MGLVLAILGGIIVFGQVIEWGIIGLMNVLDWYDLRNRTVIDDSIPHGHDYLADWNRETYKKVRDEQDTDSDPQQQNQ